MKKETLVTLALLFVIGFSIVHGFAFASFDNDHCSTTQYVAQLDNSQDHGDICDIHFKYHQMYLLSENFIVPKLQTNSIKMIIDKESYNLSTYPTFLKPPIV